jgi:hypothetical protein
MCYHCVYLRKINGSKKINAKMVRFVIHIYVYTGIGLNAGHVTWLDCDAKAGRTKTLMDKGA